MESGESIERFLENLQGEGQEEGSGGFKVDPRRALELLREQGQLGQNALLFLLRYLFELTGGAELELREWPLEYQLRWKTTETHSLEETHRVLAEGALETHGLSLSITENKARLARSFLGSSVTFDSLKDLVGTRLQRYPAPGIFGPQGTRSPWLLETYPEGRLELEAGGGRVEWVHFGISYFESWEVPVRLVVYSDQLRSDLTLTRIVEGEGKSKWLERGRRVLHGYLEEELREFEEIRLDDGFLSSGLEKALGYLSYMVNLPEGETLQRMVLDRVFFRDVFEQYWSLRTLLEVDREGEGILVVPSVPNDSPSDRKGRRPVLLWRGDTKRFGNPLFHRLSSGAGYLYSLRRGEETEMNSPELLGYLELEQGVLGLKPLGALEGLCELELVGLRRNSETRYLEPPAPQGLRIRWRSGDELASWSEDGAFQKQLGAGVVELVDRHLEELGELPENWLMELLRWAEGVSELSSYPKLSARPIFPGLNDARHSAAEFQDCEEVPVLEDRSASLPEALPFPLVLWHDPVLERLGVPLKDVRTELRRSYWQEQGREKWLARYQAQDPRESERFADLSWVELDEQWLRAEGTGEPGRLVIWREGRPLGQTSCSELEHGCLLLFRDDDFPADDYWSGPAPQALRDLRERLP